MGCNCSGGTEGRDPSCLLPGQEKESGGCIWSPERGVSGREGTHLHVCYDTPTPTMATPAAMATGMRTCGAPVRARARVNRRGWTEKGRGRARKATARVDSVDAPSFDAVEDAVAAIRRGEAVVVLDDATREDEGDLILAAEKVTEATMAFVVRHCSGVVCVGMRGSDCDRLGLAPMVATHLNADPNRTAYTVSVDLSIGVSTGISAADRTKTIHALANPNSTPDTFRRPGHVFPLRSRTGGVLARRGHTEAAVDLARLAGCFPAGVLCELVNDDGSVMRLRECDKFAKANGLCMITIDQLVQHIKRTERQVNKVAASKMPTEHGDFVLHAYVSELDGMEHVAVVKGDIGDGENVLTRLHSECLTGDILGSKRCDCGPQLQASLDMLEKEGSGVVVYLRGHEGRGIGLAEKIRAYHLQDQGRDTVEANLDLGHPIDARDFAVGAQILTDLGVQSVRLMTNNPSKVTSLEEYGVRVTERISLYTQIHPENEKYLETKRLKMGHLFSNKPECDHDH